ncbi:MAG: MFS transporter [Parasporobacterium sp.]|nr:MFS transporter [Parasporobacterium sp.]
MGKKVTLTDSRFGKWGWSMVIYTMLMYFFWAGIATDCLNLYPDAFAAKLGCDSTLLLGYATPAGFISVLSTFLFGRLVIKWGVKKMTALVLILTGIFYCFFGMVTTPVMYFIVLTLFTFTSMAFGMITTATLMGNWFPRKKGVALGWGTMGAPLCTAIFVAIVGALYNSIGIMWTSVLVGVVMIILGIATIFWVKDIPEEVGAYPDNIPEGLEELKRQREEMDNYKSPFTLGRLLKDKDMWLIALGFGMLWMVTIGVVSQFIPRMMSVGTPYPTAMTMLTITAVIGIAGSYFWGWLDQKIGTKKATVVYSLSYIVALLLLIFAQVEFLTYVALLFVGLGIGGLLNLMASLVIAVFGRYDFTAANSVVMPIAVLLMKCAFLVMALALNASGGDYTMPYLIFIGIDILGMILILCVTNKCKGKNE